VKLSGSGSKDSFQLSAVAATVCKQATIATSPKIFSFIDDKNFFVTLKHQFGEKRILARVDDGSLLLLFMHLTGGCRWIGSCSFQYQTFVEALVHWQGEELGFESGDSYLNGLACING
jgi:hypothetical protein